MDQENDALESMDGAGADSGLTSSGSDHSHPHEEDGWDSVASRESRGEPSSDGVENVYSDQGECDGSRKRYRGGRS